ncbi:MAG: ABC transporter permease [Dehalococcoidia bacterium]|nr:ABC transporter permease [Dehalococcoidia bacterium]
MSSWWPVWLVARREIVARTRTRAFQLSTAALVVLVIGGTAAAQWLPDFFEEDPPRLGLLPAASHMADTLDAVAAAFGEEIVLVALEPGDDPATGMQREDLDAVLAGPGSLLFESEEDVTLQAIVARATYEDALPDRAAALGLSVEQAQELLQPVPLEVQVISPEDPEDDAEYGLKFVTTVVLLMAISLYGQWVLVGVIEEKSNRVAEVLLAVLAPWQLLTGKVLGILALAVSQIAATLVSLVVALVIFEDATLPATGPATIAMAAVWLVLGLLLYNFVYAAVGSTTTRPEDSSNIMVPAMVPLLVGYLAALMYVPDFPDSVASRVLSLFPLTAPLVMPARTAAGGSSVIEVVVALAGMVGAIAGVIWLGARIYSGAILQTGRMSLLAAFRRSQE